MVSSACGRRIGKL